ncbi:MAG: sensor histidine kinase, partial [Spirochaetales bacterium]|nr:sensor histidine kinase [Spirochaetales bacterium]
MGENPGIIPGFSTRNTYVGRNLVGCNQGASYNVFSAFPVSGCGNSQRYVYKKDLEFIYYEITRIIDNLKDLQKMMEFTAWMQGNLPILGIESAWLFLYSQCTSGIHTYTLLTGYDMQEPGGIELKDKIPENMIFDDILSKRPDRFYCILPLLFKEEKFGLLAMEVNIFTSLVYDTKNRQQGIGVGLSIVKKIIDELGAVITVEKRKGGGTCFTIVFTDESQAGEREALQKFQATTPVSYPVQNNIKERNITAD